MSLSLALTILGGLLIFASAGSAVGKLVKAPAVVDSMTSVGVKANQIPLLAVLELAGSAGMVIGIWIPLLGQVSAACLALYFLGAVISHVRKGYGFAAFGPAFFILLIAIAVTYLELQR